jgi:vitamin B12 transporter
VSCIFKQLFLKFYYTLLSLIKASFLRKGNPIFTYKNFQYYFFIHVLILPIFSLAQKHDTLASVKIISTAEKQIVNTTTPVQVLQAAQLAKTNSINVADAVKQFAGVQVKDYGGVGGLKTVSVRSLGANHTGILYDGISINDAQGGQIDLGKFSIDNIEQIQLYNSNPTEILMPAKAFSTASLITLKSNSGILHTTEKQSLKINIQQGSFGYFSPSLTAKKLFGTKVQMAYTGWYQTAKNEYPFISYENSSTKENRKNSDVQAYRMEYDVAYFKNDSNKIKIKTFYFNSRRGLPGSIILYNSSGNQRLNDESFFTQACWQRKIKTKQEILLSTKFSADKNFYLDPSYLNSAGKLENDFYQQEIYFSAAYKYDLTKNLHAAYASDFFHSSLIRKDTFDRSFANPDRNTFLNNISINFKKENFEVTGNILHSSLKENVQNGSTGKNLQAFAPAISASLKPFINKDFYIRAFYKNIFRAPTFNDLYYTNVGNTNLKPEYAEQFNIGVTASSNNISVIEKLTVTLDGYLNNVTDKILAVPRQNLFQWSMQNIGSVKIKGLDATLHLALQEWNQIKIIAALSYTYQQALDVSDETSSAYKTQLPYTPAHTGSVQVSATYKQATFSYNFLGSSLRYRQGDVIPENALNPWSSQDISLAYGFKENYKITLAANNILNTQYEIVKFYPMPRFNYRISFLINLKTKNKT